MVRIRMDVRPSALGDFERFASQLREAPPHLRQDLRKRIRQSGRPALAAVRAAAHGIEMTSEPSAGGGDSSGLRGRIAAATRLSVLASGVRFRVIESRVDPRYGKTLTAGSEGKPWRHPVFGNRNAWVRQAGSPWFYRTLRGYAPQFRRACVRAMRDTLARLGG